jgi:acetyltransferase-like isoleucine patch superfamily enzyme
MNRIQSLENFSDLQTNYQSLQALHLHFQNAFKQQFNRSLPFADEIFDRWERAKFYGFGEGSSVYDSSYIFGDVRVGKNTWIGQFTIIDGSGGLTIGNHCTISAGVHIYTHDNVKNTLSGGKLAFEKEAVLIEDCCYIAPQSIISKGVTIGKHSLVAANTFVKNSIPAFSVVAGNPAKIIGKVVVTENDVLIEYF